MGSILFSSKQIWLTTIFSIFKVLITLAFMGNIESLQAEQQDTKLSSNLKDIVLGPGKDRNHPVKKDGLIFSQLSNELQ